MTVARRGRLRASGLSKPDTVSALAFSGGRVYAADSTGVFELERCAELAADLKLLWGGRPDSKSAMESSCSPPPPRRASSSWRTAPGMPTDSLASPHQHHAGNETHPEVLSLAPVDGRLYAVGTAFGVSASADAGQTWSQLAGGLESVTATQLVDTTVHWSRRPRTACFGSHSTPASRRRRSGGSS